jgi:hypothetical protein
MFWIFVDVFEIGAAFVLASEFEEEFVVVIETAFAESAAWVVDSVSAKVKAAIARRTP